MVAAWSAFVSFWPPHGRRWSVREIFEPIGGEDRQDEPSAFPRRRRTKKALLRARCRYCRGGDDDDGDYEDDDGFDCDGDGDCDCGTGEENEVGKVGVKERHDGDLSIDWTID